MKATITVGEERLVSARGTIIPQAANLGDGRILARYSVGIDAWFEPSGASLSTDAGKTWHETECPLHRSESIGELGDGHVMMLDQHLFKTESCAEDQFVMICSETRDGGDIWSAPRLIHFEVPDVLVTHYRPAPSGDPRAFYELPIPESYHPFIGSHEAFVGGHVFGRIIRLPDSALGVTAYCQLSENMKHQTGMDESDYLPPKSPDAGVADEGHDDVLFSAVFFRSEDEGQHWTAAGTVGQMAPGEPFDGGMLYSEGFTETGVTRTSDGRLYALMRHGSYMLLWRNSSSDGGRTWDDMMCFNYPGVAPSLCLMPNGIMAAAWGRPGMSVAFSLDGTGRTWDAIAGIMQDDQPSQKYPWLHPLDEKRLLLFYDRRVWDASVHNYTEHGIYCREITISPT